MGLLYALIVSFKYIANKILNFFTKYLQKFSVGRQFIVIYTVILNKKSPSI